MIRASLYLFLLFLVILVSGAYSGDGHGESIKIGVLLPDNSHTEIIEAVELAVEEANGKGGYKGIPFEVVVRTTEGHWGAGSKESVSLVYEDHVRAILGALDGRNAHLAEQVAAKSHMAYMETRATDPTLSQAYVPWFIRIVPNDDQQARAIMHLITEQGGGTTAILLNEEYDTRYAVKSLTREAAKKLKESPIILDSDSENRDIQDWLGKMDKAEVDHLIIPFYSDTIRELVIRLREILPAIRIYGTLAFTAGMERSEKGSFAFEGIQSIYHYGDSPTRKSKFHEAFFQKYGQLPGITACYAYDGMNLILESILQAGLDKESIKDHLPGMNYPHGVTGPISFDSMGNRTGTIQFIPR